MRYNKPFELYGYQVQSGEGQTAISYDKIRTGANFFSGDRFAATGDRLRKLAGNR